MFSIQLNKRFNKSLKISTSTYSPVNDKVVEITTIEWLCFIIKTNL